MASCSTSYCLIVLSKSRIIGRLILIKNHGWNCFLGVKLLITAQIGLGQIKLCFSSCHLGIPLVRLLHHITRINGHKNIPGIHMVSNLNVTIENSSPNLKGHICFITASYSTSICTFHIYIMLPHLLGLNQLGLLFFIILTTAGQQ